MPRRKFGDGQEIIYQDLDALSAAIEREFYDRALYEIVQRTVDAFFGDSFKVSYVGALQVTVNPGLGLQADGAAVSPEPSKKPLYLSEIQTLDLDAANGSNNRIDIICAKYARADEITASRNYKDPVDGSVSSQSFTLQTDAEADLLVVTGTASGSPAVPATPSGYVKLAELLVTAITGMSGAGAVTDRRTLMPLAGDILIDTLGYDRLTAGAATSLDTLFADIDALLKDGLFEFSDFEDQGSAPASPASGNNRIYFKGGFALQKVQAGTITPLGLAASGWTAIVGALDYCTHANLAAALADSAVPAGSRILVVSNQTLAATISVTKANMYIEFAPGVTLTAGVATTGITLGAAGNRIQGARLSGFTNGISITNTFNNNFIMGCRFASCTNEVVDNNTTPNNVVLGNISE
jgi:hypothetical protein